MVEGSGTTETETLSKRDVPVVPTGAEAAVNRKKTLA